MECKGNKMDSKKKTKNNNNIYYIYLFHGWIIKLHLQRNSDFRISTAGKYKGIIRKKG